MKHLFAFSLLFAVLLSFAHADSKASAPRKEDILYALLPKYPYEARLHYTQGRGSFLIHVRPDGSVSSVTVESSAGAPILDKAAIAALSKWRFRPGRFTVVRAPANFTMEPYVPAH